MITPVVVFIVAMVPLILQVPPVIVSVHVIDWPVHTPVGPVIAVGLE